MIVEKKHKLLQTPPCITVGISAVWKFPDVYRNTLAMSRADFGCTALQVTDDVVANACGSAPFITPPLARRRPILQGLSPDFAEIRRL